MDKFMRAARLRAGVKERSHAPTLDGRGVRRATQRRHLQRRNRQQSNEESDSDSGPDDANDTGENGHRGSGGSWAHGHSRLPSEGGTSTASERWNRIREQVTQRRKSAKVLGQERSLVEDLKRRAELDQCRMVSKEERAEQRRLRKAGAGRGGRGGVQDGSDLWICKPQGGSCGRGIRLCRYNDVKSLPMTWRSKDVKVDDHLSPSRNSASSGTAGFGGGAYSNVSRVRQRVWNVQEYIADPLCIEGRKFDLRVYVLVTSFDPLRVYVFREGLCRICTNEYDLDYNHLDDTFRHLTNFSINKNASAFVANADADRDDHGHKWSLSALFDHLDAHGYNVARLWRDMKEVAVKTLIACESEIFSKLQTLNGRDKCCYEVFGFDMLLNESLYVYLIEVNIYPSMATGSPLDKRIKQTMIADALQIKGVPVPGKATAGASHSHGGTPDSKLPGSNSGSNVGGKRKTMTAKQRREVLRRRLKTGRLGKFSGEDLAVIKESAAEFARAAATNYDIAFPSARSIRRLAAFFITPRYNNTLLHMLIQQEDSDEESDDSDEDVRNEHYGNRAVGNQPQPPYDEYPTSRSPKRKGRSKRTGRRR